MQPALDVRRVTAADSRELRRSVLRPQLPVGSPLPGDDDEQVVDIGAYLDGQIVSTCRVFVEPCPWQPGRRACRLRSMASAPGSRGLGAGTAVLTEAVAIALSDGAEVLWCEARERAVGFYRRNGWLGHGELFVNAVGPHLRMWLPLQGV